MRLRKIARFSLSLDFAFKKKDLKRNLFIVSLIILEEMTTVKHIINIFCVLLTSSTKEVINSQLENGKRSSLYCISETFSLS